LPYFNSKWEQRAKCDCVAARFVELIQIFVYKPVNNVDMAETSNRRINSAKTLKKSGKAETLKPLMLY